MRARAIGAVDKQRQAVHERVKAVMGLGGSLCLVCSSHQSGLQRGQL